MAEPDLSLNMKMPNGKRIGDCTFVEVANAFTIGELMKVYPKLGFWFRLLDEDYTPPKKRTKPKPDMVKAAAAAIRFHDDS